MGSVRQSASLKTTDNTQCLPVCTRSISSYYLFRFILRSALSHLMVCEEIFFFPVHLRGDNDTLSGSEGARTHDGFNAGLLLYQAIVLIATFYYRAVLKVSQPCLNYMFFFNSLKLRTITHTHTLLNPACPCPFAHINLQPIDLMIVTAVFLSIIWFSGIFLN